MTLTFFDLDFIIVRKGQKVKSQKRSKKVDFKAKTDFFFDFLLISFIFSIFSFETVKIIGKNFIVYTLIIIAFLS